MDSSEADGRAGAADEHDPRGAGETSGDGEEELIDTHLMAFDDAAEEDEGRALDQEVADHFNMPLDELENAVDILCALSKEAKYLKSSSAPVMKRLRGALHRCVPVVTNESYGGVGASKYRRKVENKMLRKRKINMMKQKDMQIQQSSELRAQRIAQLNNLLEPALHQLMIEGVKAGEATGKPTLVSISDDEEGGTTKNGEEAGDEAGGDEEEDSVLCETTGEYFFPRSCYTCKRRFTQPHHFYDRLCPECADLNYRKRTQLCDLRGRVVILTGGRVKIGLKAGIRLLRSGADVIVTTRFPHDAIRRYSEMEDFSEWKDRLHVYGLDLRNLGSVHAFTDFVSRNFTRLDAIVNNAAQTVRRPTSYYKHMVPGELAALPEPLRPLELSPPSYHPAIASSASGATVAGDDGAELTPVAPSGHGSGGAEPPLSSALLSQVPLTEEDADAGTEAYFPTNRLDEHEQQIDLRERNSWVMRLHEISTIEVVEVHAINCIAPFIINSRLKSLMERTEGDKFIVNVSAMEGKFYRHKTEFHPHTNMAKASLNMMTRTSAADYAKSRIFMNCVDTGWITDENPFEKSAKIASTFFQTPIDEDDAASRILDPIFHSVNTGEVEFGQFYKDYHHSEW